MPTIIVGCSIELYRMSNLHKIMDLTLGLYTKVINEDVQPNVESEIVIYVNHLKLDETQTIYLYYKNVLGYIYRQKMEYGVIQEDENTEDQVYLIKVFSTGTQERLGLNYKIDKQMYTNR